MPADQDSVRMRHMLDAAAKAVEFARGKTRGDLDVDEKLVLALCRLIEILGEAAKQVSPETRARHKTIPWRRITGTRDRIIHGYAEVNLDIIWSIVTERLPEVVVALERVLESEGDG